jgi:hypothetical protein
MLDDSSIVAVDNLLVTELFEKVILRTFLQLQLFDCFDYKEN